MPQTIFTLCFIPRMRLWVPALAGLMHLSFKKFLAWDAFSLSVFVTIYISLGVIFHQSLQHLIKKFEAAQHIVFISTMVLGAGLIFFVMRKANKAAD
jgi:membrane protein DedA with SNARE-associated domain